MKRFIPDKLYASLFWARYACLAIACLLPLSNPHTHRQTDTLGITLRFWSRWMATEEPGFWMRLFPVALNSADSFGYVVTEAPLLNWVLAPWFALGPYWGSVGARLTLLTLVFACLAACARNWRGMAWHGVPLSRVAWFFPLFSLGAVYSGKFIPDTLATVALLAAVSRGWTRPAFAVSFLLAATGLLIKPTSVVVLAWVFLHPDRFSFRRWSWVPLALVVGAVYYVLVVPRLLTYQDSPFAFYVGLRSPLQSLGAFLADPAGWLKLLGRHYFSQLGTAILLLGWAWARAPLSRAYLGLIALLVIQTLTIGALDGTHGLQHTYYYLGVFPTVCLLVLGFLHSPRVHRFAKAALWVIIAVSLLKFTARDWHWLEPSFVYSEALPLSCARLKRRNPAFPWNEQNPFRSNYEAYPTLGLCFGERSAASRGRYGFFHGAERVPVGCTVTDKESTIVLVECP
jgi:hypothetical protein